MITVKGDSRKLIVTIGLQMIKGNSGKPKETLTRDIAKNVKKIVLNFILMTGTIVSPYRKRLILSLNWEIYLCNFISQK